MWKFLGRTAVLLFVAWSLAAPSFAQTTNATISGTVSDATGALIPGVTVTATNTGTGIVNDTISNETGTYQFLNLQTGNYELSAELPGFQTATYTDVVLGGGQQVRLNFTLQVASAATTVEVSVAADTLIATTSSSVGNTLPEAQLMDLPTADRNVMELLRTLPGTGATEGTIDGNFAGGRVSSVNVTRDGFTVSSGRYNQGTFSTTFTSADLVEEVSVVTGTVDAEASRGSGQVQMVTRSGTNDFNGSIFWNNQNSLFQASDWFSNFNNAESSWTNRNQIGGRLGGPIIPNKTFFFFLIDEQRFVQKENFVGTVLTAPARQGLFRYFPGTDNNNVNQSNPTVDRDGNPVQPGANPLATLDLFGQGRGTSNVADPNRTGYDPSGWIQNVLLPRMPLPNDYTVGDGLNTAGIRFQRRLEGLGSSDGQSYDQDNRDQVNVRIDHYFNPDNKFSFVYTFERTRNTSTQAGVMQWPGGYNGANWKDPRLYNFVLVSTLSPNVVNEVRVGYRAHKIQSWAPFYVGRNGAAAVGEGTESAQEAYALLPKVNAGTANEIPVQYVPSLFPQGFMNFGAGFGSTRGADSPLFQYGDTLSFNRGEHGFKAGFEIRRDRTDGWNDNNFTPRADSGPGNVPAPIDTVLFPTLTSTNVTTARNLLYDLSGSITDMNQGFDLTSPSDTEFKGYLTGAKMKERDWHANEMTTFFKDTWNVSSDVTLNLGLQWEYYGVPYEGRGLAGRVIGDSPQAQYDGFCGIGCGALTNLELVGKNSSHPDKTLYNNDWNNFGPNVGFSWDLPWFERNTVLRAGYGISYSGAQIKGAMGASGLDAGAGTLPGLAGISGGSGLTYTNTAFWSLANIGVGNPNISGPPFEPQSLPLQPIALGDPRTLTLNMYEPDRATPYIQNFNLSIQRELANNLILDVAYIGTKATKLYDRLDYNNVNIYASLNGETFLDAFNTTRAGGNSPMFDAMLMGLNVPGVGVVNGTTLTGSTALRRYSSTRADLARGEVGAVADFLSDSTNITGTAGGFIANAGLPANFLTFNPQFNAAGLNGNNSNSTYHSLQVQLTKRMSNGLAASMSYTWSKALGVLDSEGTLSGRDPKNWGADHSRLGFDRAHIINGNSSWAIPVGRNRQFLSAAPGWVQQVVGDWQLGGLFRWSSGAPLTLSASGLSNIYQATNNTPDIVGTLPDPVLTFRDGALPTYFPTLSQERQRETTTTVNTLNTANNNWAIVDGSGNRVLQNPEPGFVGNLGQATLEGPSRFELDMNLSKRFQLDESRQLEIRVDGTNVLNHPIFDNPNLQINSSSFGLISGASEGRKFLMGARLNF